MMLRAAAMWCICWSHGAAWRMFTKRLKALATTEAVSVESKLLSLSTLVCYEASSMDAASVLLLDDSSCLFMNSVQFRDDTPL